MSKLKKLFAFIFNRETFLYVICGVATTLVSFVSLKAADLIMPDFKYMYLLENTISWVIAVVFAFVVNKLLVFESKSWAASVLKREIPAFLVARIASYFIEQGILWLFMTPLGFNDKVFDFKITALSGLMVAKLIASVLVVIINYVLSKFIIFKKNAGEKTE